MGGRQYTGPQAQKKTQPKNKSKARARNALAIAEYEVPHDAKLRKHRFGDADFAAAPKRRRAEDEEDEDGESHQAGSKKPRRGNMKVSEEEVEIISDSEDGEVRIGDVPSDDDSSIDSDEAFGESDDERYSGFRFGGNGGSRPKKRRPDSTHDDVLGDDHEINLDESEDDEQEPGLESDAESEAFAADAVDLATLLDDPDSEEEATKKQGRKITDAVEGEELWNEGVSDGLDEASEDELPLSDDDEVVNDSNISALKKFVSSMHHEESTKGPRRPDAQELMTPSDYGLNPTQKVTVADLLPTVTDPLARKSLKMMEDDGKRASKLSKGIPQKLDVPLAKRQQDRLDRAAACEKSKETMGRWVDTVKHNRRAEHLIFPLPDPDAEAAKNTSRLPLVTEGKPMNDLEDAIQKILIESGLAPVNGKTEAEQIQEFEELATNQMPIEEVKARRAELRRARDLLFREEIRAKRIKKIKSKSYRRVHRKERERNLLKDQEAMMTAGIEPSDDEIERLDRQRAEERMGARHKNSKWAKGVKRSGQTIWDEEARAGVVDSARRDEELRKRQLGNDVNDEESMGSTSESDDDGLSNEDQTDRIKHKLDKMSRDGAQGPGSGLASMKFMQKADAAQKARNEEDLKRLQRDLANDEELSSEDSETEEASGRRKYGPQKDMARPRPSTKKRNEFEERVPEDEEEDDEENVEFIVDRLPRGKLTSQFEKQKPTRSLSKQAVTEKGPPDSEENEWLKPLKHDRSKRKLNPFAEPIIDPMNVRTDTSSILKATESYTTPRASRKHKKASQLLDKPDDSSDSDSDSSSFAGFSEPSTPTSKLSTDPRTRNLELIAQVFAGDDVIDTSFADEKAALTKDEGPPSPSSNIMPGWGSWTGVGLTKSQKRESKRHNKPSASHKAAADEAAAKRKDANKQRVIISEKRVSKSAKYLASQLPFPFETKSQYERSLRLPVGPEWTTKQSFQDGTKPRVIVKSGVVIKPMEKPMI